MHTAPKHEEIMAALTARKHWEQRQATWYQMRHDGLRRKNKPWPNAADMHYPLADGIIEKLKPTYISQIYATDTVASFAALTSDFTSYQAGAAQWFDHQLKQESNFEEELDIAIDVMAQTGRGPVKVYWDAECAQIVFEAINPLYLIVPAWTGKLAKADWIVHVQRYSKAAYKRLEGFVRDDATIGRILSGDGIRESDSGYDQQRTSREGLTKGAGDSEIIVWELFYRDEAGAHTTMRPEVHVDDSGHPAVIREFIDIVRSGDWADHHGDHAVHRTEVLDACYESARQGREVTI